MLSFKEYVEQLYEKVLTVGFNQAREVDREKHRGEIHDILHRSYKGVNPDDHEEGYGGHKSGSPEESKAIHADISGSIIKATKRAGKITSVNLYKDKFGRKSIAAGTDGTAQGKTDYIKNKSEDHVQKRSWGEVSGKAGHIAKKVGNPVLPNHLAKTLTGKEDVETHSDGETYTRSIGGKKHAKFLVGHPKI